MGRERSSNSVNSQGAPGRVAPPSAATNLTGRQIGSHLVDHHHHLRRNRRGRDGQPAGQRAHRRRAGSSSPTSSPRPGATTRGPTCVVLRAEGRGFNAGVDIKEMQDTEGFDALIGANKGCFAAFTAVYECEVPVIAAVNGFCLGGGVGLVGNADVHRGRRRRHLRPARGRPGRAGRRHPPGRLVPQHMMRAMVYTGRPATAAELHALRLGARGRAPGRAARRRARGRRPSIAAKTPTVIRAAKESLNGIDPFDVKQQLPLRAGLHLRAQPHRAWPTSSATPSSTSETRT